MSRCRGRRRRPVPTSRLDLGNTCPGLRTVRRRGEHADRSAWRRRGVAKAGRTPQTPRRGYSLCLCGFNRAVAGDRNTAIHIRFRRSCASGLDRIVPAVRLDEICQRAAVAVGPVLRRIWLHGDPLPKQVDRCELRRLRSPARDAVPRLLRLGCVDSQDSHTKPAPDVIADVDRVAVDDPQHISGGITTSAVARIGAISPVNTNAARPAPERSGGPARETTFQHRKCEKRRFWNVVSRRRSQPTKHLAQSVCSQRFSTFVSICSGARTDSSPLIAGAVRRIAAPPSGIRDRIKAGTSISHLTPISGRRASPAA